MTLTRTAAAYVPFDLEVAAVRRLSPTFVRVAFAGPALAELHDGGARGLRDTRIKLVVPDRPGHEPRLDVDVSDPEWYRRWLALDPSVRGHLRTYTVRRFTKEPEPLLEVDFVLHLDEDGHGGPAGTWAAQAVPGQRLTVLGPNRRHPDPGGYEWSPPAPPVGGTRQILLVGDETALPAIGAILEGLPPGYAGEALVEVPGIDDVQQLTAPPGVRVTYLTRNGRPRGVATLEALATRLTTSLSPAADPEPAEDELLWETPTGRPPEDGVYAWVAGEASVVREVRRALIGRHGLTRRQVAFMGYWRQGRAEG